MIELFWCERTRATRILWLLEELGQPFHVTRVAIRSGDKSQAFLEASPMGKVPAIRDGDVTLADSAAIALYLADAYPQASLAPAVDDAGRAPYLYWMVFTPSVMEPAMAERFSGAESKRATHAWGDFDSMIETLVHQLEKGPWILGETFSAADVLVGSTCYFLRLFAAMPDHITLNAYTDRCLSRPAFKRALEWDAATS